MSPFIRIATLGALTLSLLAPAAVLAQADAEPTPPADGELAQVVDVISGDTIRVERENGDIEDVRYIGIDTPEVSADDQDPEPYSRQAALANAGFIEDQVVVLETDTGDRDRFDQLLRYVWAETEDGWVMVNERLVALGLAEVATYEPNTRYQAYFLDSQEVAKLTGRGMHDAAAVARQLIGAEAMAYLFFDAYDARDVPTLRRLLSSDVVYRLPGNERYRGKKKVMSKFREEWAELDPVVTIRNSIAQPEAAVLEVTIVVADEQVAGSAEPAEPVEPTEPAESPAPAESTEPVDPADSAQPADPADDPEPAESAETAEPAQTEQVPEAVDVPAASVGIEAVAVQQWPNDKLADYRLYRDE